MHRSHLDLKSFILDLCQEVEIQMAHEWHTVAQMQLKAMSSRSFFPVPSNDIDESLHLHDQGTYAISSFHTWLQAVYFTL